MNLPPLWFTVLLRGSKLEPVSRASINRGQAQIKADGLSYIHMVGPEKQWTVAEARVIIIDASEYYEKD